MMLHRIQKTSEVFATSEVLVRGQPRRGIVLLAVLVVIVLLSLAAYQYSDLMVAEYKGVVNAQRTQQARAFADSGIHYAAAVISNADNLAAINGSIWDNPEIFHKAFVGEPKPGGFRIVAPGEPDDSLNTTVRAGVIDESGKINPNALMKLDPKGQVLYDALLKLPNVTDEIAACIVDWLDADSEPRQNGAESDFYSGDAEPYLCKNGPLDSIGELLYVKGITRGVLYGNDLNGNGIQDPDEVSDTEGFSRGLAAYLTVYSREQNTDSKGQALTYVNESDLNLFFEKLAPAIGEDMTKYIIMYRQYGPSTSSKQSGKSGKSSGKTGGKSGKTKGKTKGKGKSSTPATIAGNLAAWSPDFEQKAEKKISSLFDLVNSQVSIAGKGKNEPTVVFQSPLNETTKRRELLPKLFEYATIFQEIDLPARVNVNTACREVLTAIPEISSAEIESIVALRPSLSSGEPPDSIYQTPAWLLTEAKLTTATLKKLEKYVTTKSQVYRIQSVGYFEGGGPTARIEAVIDTNAGRPRIMMWRDVSELGGGKISDF
ncbi:MAG: general secretion pathway protein GspK [Gemmataceae bacterium]|nr:general secretion pathway protein GspK [Gemmataceae bacterium]